MVERNVFQLLLSCFFGVFLFLLSASSVLAVACGGGCGGSITCDAGLTCTSGVCYQTYVACPTACGSAASDQLNATCGTHYCAAVPIPTAAACPMYCGYAGGDVVSNGDCTTTTCPAIPDSSPPAVPAGSVSFTPDATCKDTYTASYSWNAVSDVGCAGLNSTPYWAQGSSSSDFSTVLYGWDNTWVASTPRSQTSATAYPPGTQLYFHVRSRDALDNQSAWSTTLSVVIPSPSPYPTIHVEGPLSEDINNTCYPMSLLHNLTLEPVISPALGVTPICTMPTTDSYACNFIIDNQKGNCVSPNITVTMNATYEGYGTIGWRTGSGGGECTGSPTSRSYSAGNSESNVPIYLAYNTTVPTPLPTVTPGGPTLTPTPPTTPTPTPPLAAGWFKLKDTTFNSRMSNRQNYIPNTIQLYDTTGDDSIANHHIMIGSSGLLLQNGPLQPGANAYEGGELTYSTNNWYTDGYTANDSISVAQYTDYVIARKGYTTITALSEITTDGVYVISSPTTPVPVTPEQFNGKKVVLVVQGTASIEGNFAPTLGTVALLATTINIDPAVTDIHAILIGGAVSTGDSDVNPLKITGNLISEAQGGLTIGRSRTDGRKPSLFVVSSIQMYLDLLPYLSVSTYDWKQVQ